MSKQKTKTKNEQYIFRRQCQDPDFEKKNCPFFKGNGKKLPLFLLFGAFFAICDILYCDTKHIVDPKILPEHRETTLYFL